MVMGLFWIALRNYKMAADGVLLYRTKNHPKHLTKEKSSTTEPKMQFPNVILFLASVFVIVIAAPQVSMHSSTTHYTYLIIIGPSPRTRRLEA
jgi:hypothetical protein